MSQHSDRSAQRIGADSTAIDDRGDEQIGISIGDAGSEEPMGMATVGPDNSVFLQHVGKQHVDHILATVENKVSTDSILALLSASPERYRLRVQLEQAFPDHSCNCWGIVGSMKARLFEKMQVGDLLLIAPTYSRNDLDESGIEYLGVIKALGPNSGSTELSQQLWGDSSYPYTIFFSAIKRFAGCPADAERQND